MTPTVLVAVFAVLSLSGTRLHAQTASSLYKRGLAAEAQQDYDAAFDLYQKANLKNPRDIAIRAALYRIRTTDSALHLTNGRKLLEAGNEQGALAEFLHAAEIDPGNEAAQQEIAKMRAKVNGTAPELEAAGPEAAGELEEINSCAPWRWRAPRWPARGRPGAAR